MTGHPTTTALKRHNYIFHIFLLFFGSKMEFVLSKYHNNQSEHSRLIIWAYHYCPRTRDDHFYCIYHFERTMGPCIEHFLRFGGYWNSPCRIDVFTAAVVVLLLFLLKKYLHLCKCCCCCFCCCCCCCCCCCYCCFIDRCTSNILFWLLFGQQPEAYLKG